MKGYFEKEINKEMCEFVETILPNHFVIEGDICSHAYYIELEGSIQSTQEECFRFISSIKANENGMNRVIEYKNELLKMQKDIDLQFMSANDVIEAMDLIINERDGFIKKALHSFSNVRGNES